MKTDPIVQEELWRSIPVYFVSFLAIGALNLKGYISVEGIATFLLALLPTAVHFSLMVRYRKKEGLIDSSIFSIIGYIFQSGSPEKGKSRCSASRKTSRIILAIAVFTYIVYLYASLKYGLDQIFWPLVLVFFGASLSEVVFSREKRNHANLLKWGTFYATTSVFIFARYLVLGYPVLPVLKGAMIVGTVLLMFLLLMQKRSTT
ncbi:hypothetical protein ACSAZK_14235 [Methanosarcina sp. Mfa9]|uniref:hypothetical protein n=1 Tax=Methanosarcina sp. Mfa9 TaxID=3439063 RepID=UPI003F84E52F